MRLVRHRPNAPQSATWSRVFVLLRISAAMASPIVGKPATTGTLRLATAAAPSAYGRMDDPVRPQRNAIVACVICSIVALVSRKMFAATARRTSVSVATTAMCATVTAAAPTAARSLVRLVRNRLNALPSATWSPDFVPQQISAAMAPSMVGKPATTGTLRLATAAAPSAYGRMDDPVRPQRNAIVACVICSIVALVSRKMFAATARRTSVSVATTAMCATVTAAAPTAARSLVRLARHRPNALLSAT